MENLGKSTKIDCGVCVRRRVYTRALHAHCLWKIRKISCSTQLQALNCLFNLAKRKILEALQSGPEIYSVEHFSHRRKWGGRKSQEFSSGGKTNNTHLLFFCCSWCYCSARVSKREQSLSQRGVLHVEPLRGGQTIAGRGVCGFSRKLQPSRSKRKNLKKQQCVRRRVEGGIFQCCCHTVGLDNNNRRGTHSEQLRTGLTADDDDDDEIEKKTSVFVSKEKHNNKSGPRWRTWKRCWPMSAI